MDSSLLPGRLRLHSNDRRRVALVLLRAFQSGDPRWMSYQQAQEKKGQVREDEKSTTIFFAKP
ncbi:MAG: ArdC family protein [Bryobacteraceae bacterium]